MNKNNYELTVLVNGKPLRQFFHNNRFYIESRNGTEYTIKLKNHTHKRIMAVFSVDGIDALHGGKASEAKSGYIVNAYSTTEITGYRIDDNNVAKFKFSDGTDSYATQVEYKFDEKKIAQVKNGEIAPSSNNGVIGIRVWEEKQVKEIPTWYNEIWKNFNTKKRFYTTHPDKIPDVTNLIYYSGCVPLNFTQNNITGCMLHNLSGYIPLSNTSTKVTYSASLRRNISDVNQYGELSAIDKVKLEPPVMDIFSDENYIGSTCDSSVISSYLNNSDNITNGETVPNFSMGTTWGEKTEDKVIKVNFEKADKYIDLELYYLPKEEMVRIGIDFENAKKAFISGFPKAFGENEYCKQPVGWRQE